MALRHPPPNPSIAGPDQIAQGVGRHTCEGGGPIFFTGTSRLPSSHSCESGEVCTWALGGGGPGHGGEEKVRLRVRVCEFAHFLSTSEARDLNGDGASGASLGRKGSGAQDQWGQEGIQTRSAAFLWELLLSWRQS